MVNVLKNPR